jgi:putative DNA methylase
MPLVRSFDLSTKKGKRAWVEPHVDRQTREITFHVRQAEKGKGPEGTVDRRGAKCLACGTAVPFEHIRDEGKAGRMGAQLLATVTEGSRGRNYHSPNGKQEKAATVETPADAPTTDLPPQALGFRVQLYGMTKHRDLFTPRQLVALTAFSDLVREARERVRRDALAAGLADDDMAVRKGGTGARAYAESVGVYLALALSRWTDYSNTITTWNTTNENLRNAFARQAIPMTWDFAEANLMGSRLSFPAACEWVAPVLEALPTNAIAALVQQQDARNLRRGPGVVISTDPPYYDNIGYADLSDFFYVWIRKTTRDVFPELFSTLLVPKEEELIASPFRFNGSSEDATAHFEIGLMNVFEQLRNTSLPEYPLTIYYAFKQAETVIGEGVASIGWETMLNGLLEAGYAIVGTWPMRTERSVRTVSLGTNALASSIVLVCRPRPEDAPVTSRRQFVAALRQELPKKLCNIQSGYIAPVDLAQASIGPGMAVYSRYAQVLEPNGERLTVRTALQLINQMLDEFLAETEGDVDADTRFAVDWFKQYGFQPGPFGTADVLARAKNTSVQGLQDAGVLTSSAGKVQLLAWDELDAGWDPTTDRRPTAWEATHHLIERLNTHGEAGAALLLAKMPADLAAAARQLAYRLYSICERKGWAEHARDYNALVVSWSESQERAAAVKGQGQQGRLFNA